MYVYMFNESLNNWRISLMHIDITFIKRFDPKIVLPHRYQILRPMNKTSQYRFFSYIQTDNYWTDILFN